MRQKKTRAEHWGQFVKNIVFPVTVKVVWVCGVMALHLWHSCYPDTPLLSDDACMIAVFRVPMPQDYFCERYFPFLSSFPYTVYATFSFPFYFICSSHFFFSTFPLFLFFLSISGFFSWINEPKTEFSTMKYERYHTTNFSLRVLQKQRKENDKMRNSQMDLGSNPYQMERRESTRWDTSRTYSVKLQRRWSFFSSFS